VLIGAHRETECLSCSATYCIERLMYKPSTNGTVCKWTELTAITQKLLLNVQTRKSAAHFLYKYCTKCTLCNWTVLIFNYTEAAAATCSAAQQHSKFLVQKLYKVYNLKLNCTYINYTEASATYSAAQQHSNFNVKILYKEYNRNWNVLTVITQKLLLHVPTSQQHDTYTVQNLYKLYSLQQNNTYSN